MTTAQEAAVTQCEKPRTVTRTRIYRAIVTHELIARMSACRHAQRAVFNLGVAAIAGEGGTLAPLQKNPDAPEAFFAQLTRWRAKHEWLRNVPVAVARPALSETRQALDSHGKTLKARVERLTEHEG